MLLTIVLVLLILALVGALPTWPHSKAWGTGPAGILVVVLLIVIILMVAGYR